MEFPWRCNVDTIAMDLKVSWEMSVEVASFFAARMDWVAAVPPLIASGAFDNVAKGRVEYSRDRPDLRRRSAELVDFLRTLDAQAHATAHDTRRRG